MGQYDIQATYVGLCEEDYFDKVLRGNGYEETCCLDCGRVLTEDDEFFEVKYGCVCSKCYDDRCEDEERERRQAEEELEYLEED